MNRRIRRSQSSHSRRLAFEHLEDRRVLASFGDSVFAVFEGEVAVADQPATLEIVIDPAEFELVKGEVTLGFQVRAKKGEALSPQPAGLVDEEGNPVEPEPGDPFCRAGDESLAIVSLGAGTYEIQISGDGSSIGAFELAVFLAGDVDGNRRVDADDTSLLRGMLNTSSASSAYDVDADVNLDARITGYDLSLQQRNLGAAMNASAPLSFEIDPALVPDRPELSPVTEDDAGSRPTARLIDSSGIPADFVANELILMTSDVAKLDAFVDRWAGDLLLTIDPAAYGVAGLEKMHVVRIDASGADPSKLSQDLKSPDPNSQGVHKVSSPEGLKLLSAAASEAAAGHKIAVNWIGKADQFLDRTTIEAPIPSGGSFDAFQLPHLAEGDLSNQDTGVAEAWRVLELAGRLGNRIDFAVLDGGFVPDADWPAGLAAYSTVPFTSPLNSPSADDDAAWHGTKVVSAGLALPDNAFGSAGTAGPIARPITVYTELDFVTSIVSVLTARFAGADVINMSYRTRVPAAFSAAVLPFDLTTNQLRNEGALLFASAGNDAENIDARETILGVELWEKAWHTPAENAGVIAVGALAYNSQVRASLSNFGSDQLDIYAPGVIEVGPDPSNSGNIAQIVSGTSFASPFAAGVAALIWAANPSLSANAVENILYSTAVKRPHVSVHQYVNALDAVLAAIGDVPPYVDITSPATGSQYSRRAESVLLAASVEDYEDDFVHVAWSSNRDGLITQSNVVSGVTALASPSDLSYGDHVITVAVTDSGGQVHTDSVNVTIVNDPPTMTILSPTTSGPFFEGQSIQLLAQSSDANEASLQLADSAVAWSSSLDGFLGTGHSLVTTLSAGVHAITVTGTDPLGATGTNTIGIEVDVPTSGFPTATIISPASTDGSATVFLQAFDDSAGRWYADVELVGQATDPEDGQLTGGALVWTTNRGDLQTPLLGTGETLTVRLYAADQFGGTHLITLVATDSDLQTSAPFTLSVRLFGLV